MSNSEVKRCFGSPYHRGIQGLTTNNILNLKENYNLTGSLQFKEMTLYQRLDF